MKPLFIPGVDLEVIEDVRKALLQHSGEGWEAHPARAFVLVHRRPGAETVYRAYPRARFLALMDSARVPGDEFEGEVIAGVIAEMFGLGRESAPVLAPGAEATGEAVVIIEGQVAGAWVEPVAEQSRARLLPVEVLDQPSVPQKPPPPPLLFASRGMRSADPLEPRLEDMVEGAQLSDEVKSLPVDEEEIRRTPHIDVPGAPVEPGQSFRVEVRTSDAPPRPDEEAEEIVIAAPRDKKEFEVLVWLVPSDHFEVEGAALDQILVKRATPNSKPVPFQLRVKEELEGIEGAPSVSAVFMYESRPTGKVTRAVPIAGIAAGDEAGERKGRFELQSLAKAPDLTVVISRSGAGQSYRCLVTAPEIPPFTSPVEQEWDREEGAPEGIRKRMERFAEKGIDTSRRQSRLLGAGHQLFRNAPKNFRDAVAALEKKVGAGAGTILIVTEEAAMPWELLIPTRPQEPGNEEPLGVRHTMGRWPDPESRPTLQTFALQTSRVIAPEYESEARKLKWAEKEAAFVCGSLKGTRLRPATFESVERDLGNEMPSLLHFVCHGATGSGIGETIWLDGDEELNSEELLGMAAVREACAKARPVVFLNACEVGRTVPSLVGVEGFAQSFVQMGARAVIAPLWRVKDKLAHEVALGFYGAALANPKRPFADILREIRAKTYTDADAEDTYAAYCLYGDPMLCMGTDAAGAAPGALFRQGLIA